MQGSGTCVSWDTKWDCYDSNRTDAFDATYYFPFPTRTPKEIAADQESKMPVGMLERKMFSKARLILDRYQNQHVQNFRQPRDCLEKFHRKGY